MSDVGSLEARVRGLESKLRVLEDIEAIKQLHYEYGRAVDEERWDDFENCFTEDCQGDYYPFAGKFTGRAEIGRFIKEGIEGRLTFILHFSIDPLINVNGDEATGKWYFIVPCTMLEQGEEKAVWQMGHYDVVYRRVASQWKMARMRCSYFLTSDFDKGWAKDKVKLLPSIAASNKS